MTKTHRDDQKTIGRAGMEAIEKALREYEQGRSIHKIMWDLRKVAAGE